MQPMRGATPTLGGVVTQGPRRGLLWRRLESADRAAHAQAEASLAPLARPDSLPRYAALFLSVLWGFQAPLERVLGHQELPSAVGWATDRRRLGALAADLTDLGVTGTSLPEAAGCPPWPVLARCREALLPTGRPWWPPGPAASDRSPRLGPVPVTLLRRPRQRALDDGRDLGLLPNRSSITSGIGSSLGKPRSRAFAAFSRWAGNAVSAAYSRPRSA